MLDNKNMANIFERIVTYVDALAGTLLYFVVLVIIGLSIWNVFTHFTPVEALTVPLLHAIGAIVISITISLEGLVYIFKAGAEGISLLLCPAFIVMTSILAMVGLGIYQWLAAKADTALSISANIN